MKLQYQRHFVVILGARPNFVKAAPFFREAKNYPRFSFTVIHTGQHFDDNMSKIFFDQMGLPKPDIHLNIKGKYHTEKIGKWFSALKSEIEKIKPHGVIVFGDVNSTLAGAIAAATNGPKLIHIESGLRSHDRRMPEEINRVIVDHLSDHLFVTESSGMDNLKLEGVGKEKVSLVGNIMINSLEIFKDDINKSTIVSDLKLKKKGYIAVTIHRQENTDDPVLLEKILNVLVEVSKKYEIVFPLHPSTENHIRAYGFDGLLDKFRIIEPLGYFDFIKLVKESKAIVTDSGGIQEESTHLGVTCCTMRDNSAPCASQQSSITFRLYFFDIFVRRVISAGHPSV